MKKFLLLTCLVAFFSKNVSAFTLFLPYPEKHGGYCVSNDSGLNEKGDDVLAPIYELANHFYLPTGMAEVAKQTLLEKKECSYGEDCEWTGGPENATQYFFSEKPIMDREWHVLPTAITDGKNSYSRLLQIEENQGGKFHLSVLADNAYFLFYKGGEFISPYEPAFLLAVDTPDANKAKRLLLKQCNASGDSWKPEENFNQEIKTTVLHGGKKWVHLTFEMKINNNELSLTVSDGSLTHRFDKISSGDLTHIDRVAVRTIETVGFFKKHKYSTFKSSQSADSFLETTFTLEEPEPFCVEVVYKGQWTASLNEESRGKIIAPKVLAMSNEWKTERVEESFMVSGKYVFRISAQSENMFIRDVKYCKKQEALTFVDMRNKLYNKVIYCESLAKTSSTRVLIEKSNLKKICKMARNEDCKEVVACDPEGCFCLSGFTTLEGGDKKCSEECKNGTFGLNCGFTNDKTCKNKDKHTGKCSGLTGLLGI